MLNLIALRRLLGSSNPLDDICMRGCLAVRSLSKQLHLAFTIERYSGSVARRSVSCQSAARHCTPRVRCCFCLALPSHTCCGSVRALSGSCNSRVDIEKGTHTCTYIDRLSRCVQYSGYHRNIGNISRKTFVCDLIFADCFGPGLQSLRHVRFIQFC